MALRQIRAGRRQLPNVSTYVGEKGVIFYDEDNGTLRLSDGVTPGGINNVLPVATTTELGAVKAGPGVNITSEGEITIDASGLPIGFGDFFAYVAPGPTGANAAWLSSVVTNQDIVVSSNGTGSVSVEGEFNVFATDGPLNTRDPSFSVGADGQVEIKVPEADPIAGAVKIIGSSTGLQISPAVTGVMLHITGQNNLFASQYIDGVNNFPNYIGRRYNGNTASPTAVLSGQTIARFSASGYATGGFPGSADATISMDALEDHTATAQGAVIRFLTKPVGGNVRAEVASIDNANGFTVTKATIIGNLTVGNISATGISGTLSNGNSNVAIAANGNVSVSATGTANVVVVANTGTTFNGNITYNTATGDAGTVTQLNSKTDTVIANGRTGRIVSNAASLSQNTAVTFTVNNNYVAANDVIILNHKGGGTANSYNFNIANVNTGSFQIQIQNFTNGALAEALTFNFAVIKVT